ncbi:MFS transporter [Litorisediminicola beolgyonensis]|uniref:MFS transporter n=1 Tax=Litorisediminicola beolgyonensis TaxID=1173614 RepID=A0ABW3ZDR0_9RHOB
MEFLRTNARWLAAGALLTFLSSFGQTFFISIFAGELSETFDLSHSAWGGAYSLGTMLSALAMVWAGSLTDHFRSRALGAAVLGLLSLACLFMALNHIGWLLPLSIFALRFAGQGMASLIAQVSMSRWFVATRGKALSVANLGVSLGQTVLPLIFVALMGVMDWRWLWVLAAGIALAGIPVLQLLLRQERTPQSHAKEDQSQGMDGRHWTRLEALRLPLFWAMIPALIAMPAYGTVYFFFQVHFTEVKGWELLDFVALAPVFTVTAVGSMLVTGWAVDRFGVARVIPAFLLPASVAFAISAEIETLWGAAAALFCLGLTQGANAVLPNAFWAEFFGTRHLGAIKALGAALMVLGTAIGPGLTGLFLDLGIGIETQYLGVAVYMILASAAMTWAVLGNAPRLRPSYEAEPRFR